MEEEVEEEYKAAATVDSRRACPSGCPRAVRGGVTATRRQAALGRRRMPLILSLESTSGASRSLFFCSLASYLAPLGCALASVVGCLRCARELDIQCVETSIAVLALRYSF